MLNVNLVSLYRKSNRNNIMTNTNIKRLLRDVLVAILSAILTYLTASCAGALTIGSANKTSQSVSSKIDSTKVSPSIVIQR